jgi:hypothetical protein
MPDDYLTSMLTALCRRFSEDPLKGRYHVASESGLSEQYIYQIISGKPMQNGEKRSVGKVARAKLSKAFPDWLEHDHAQYTLPAQDQQFINRIQQEVARYDVPQLIKDAIIGMIKQQPPKHAGSSLGEHPPHEQKAA